VDYLQRNELERMKTLRYVDGNSHQSGISLIEVLIALVILLVGLLGLAGMMIQSQRSEFESYQRVQALILMQDMVGRINANRKAALCYVTATYLGTGIDTTATPPTCTSTQAPSTTATQQATAVQDMKDWNALLLGATTSSGSNQVGAMVGARGCVTHDTTTDTYMVSVVWQGTSATSAPPTGLSCASGKYGSETLRRGVSARFKIATLN
jgi:type IV pilus assembly protein PilV